MNRLKSAFRLEHVSYSITCKIICMAYRKKGKYRGKRGRGGKGRKGSGYKKLKTYRVSRGGTRL